jgi:hypothetical protein
MQNGIQIKQNSTIVLNFVDRVRALFGKKINLTVIIVANNEGKIIKSEVHGYLDPIFGRSKKTHDDETIGI